MEIMISCAPSHPFSLPFHPPLRGSFVIRDCFTYALTTLSQAQRILFIMIIIHSSHHLRCWFVPRMLGMINYFLSKKKKEIYYSTDCGYILVIVLMRDVSETKRIYGVSL